MELEDIIGSKVPDIKAKIHQIQALQYLTDFNKFDVALNVPVGYGKSLVYQVFPLIHEVVKKEKACSLVITPLNIIETDQMASLGNR
jgi:superfamily II DNA helicase RecQ